ncbi:hypothetical protein CR513_04338, partial [Mucuna pruriens]
MEVTLIRAQIVESQKSTTARFLHGLNRDIQDIVELHNYTSISTLVHEASKDKEKREKKLLKKDRSLKKGSATFKGHREVVCKVNAPNSNTHKSSNIKCFKCLGKRHIAS